MVTENEDREIPLPTPPWLKAGKRPFTPMEALMSSAAGEEPEVSVTELLSVRESLVDAFDSQLNEEEKWVLNATITEQMSLRSVANQIGTSKTTVARIRDTALTKLKLYLTNEPRTMQALTDLGLLDDTQ